ncbi:MAG: RNA polymerase sigma factor [Pseudomonadota bacterium]
MASCAALSLAPKVALNPAGCFIPAPPGQRFGQGMHSFQDRVVEYLPDLWRYALSLTRNRDAADDLVQDCVERAIRKQALWQPSGSLKAWLMTLLLNQFRNNLASGKGRPSPMPIDEMVSEPRAAETLAPRLDLADTARALTTLPEDQRETLLLVVVGGLSYREAAEALDIPLGTLMSRLGRARAALRVALGQNEGAQVP